MRLILLCTVRFTDDTRRVGDLRFRLPVALGPYNGTYNATTFGSSCIQQICRDTSNTTDLEPVALTFLQEVVANANTLDVADDDPAALPTPLVDLYVFWFYPLHAVLILRGRWDANGRPRLSEAAMLGHAKYLSEDIGFRTVGTREHALGDAWMLKKAEELQQLTLPSLHRYCSSKTSRAFGI